MAAEYSRELSRKVFAGQCRLARSGFKLGGAAGYGLRRLLLDSQNSPKLVLRAGERKSLATERVIYAVGPDQEVQVVREIYSMFVNQRLSINAIVRLLNSRGTPREVPGPWRSGVVSTILTHPKYTGCIVFNQTSARLKSKRIFNPREQWVVQPNCFAAIVPAEVFEGAQARLARGVARRTDEELLSDLRVLAETHGKLTIRLLIDSPDVASWATYRRRFGSVRRAFDLAQNCPQRGPASEDARTTARRLRIATEQCLICALEAGGVRVRARYPFLHLRRYGRVGLEIARCVETRRGELRWKIRARKNGHKCCCIAIRLTPDNMAVKDYILLSKVPKMKAGFWLGEDGIRRTALVRRSAADVVRTVIDGKWTRRHVAPS